MDATPPSNDDWLMSPTGGPDEPLSQTGGLDEPQLQSSGLDEPLTPSAASLPSRRPSRFLAPGFLAGGLVAGVLGGFVLGHRSDGTTTFTPAGSQQQGSLTSGGPGGVMPQQGGTGQQAPQLSGGLDGEQRVQGTLTSVGSSSVTVSTSAGSATYKVNGSTQIVRNGQMASLSDLKAGEAVFLHVYTSGGTLLAERLFAGTSPMGGFPGGPPGVGQNTQPGGAVNGPSGSKT
jgi:hypothetical protein